MAVISVPSEISWSPFPHCLGGKRHCPACPQAELTFCDPAKPGTLPYAGFPGLPDVGAQSYKSSQPEDGPI